MSTCKHNQEIDKEIATLITTAKIVDAAIMFAGAHMELFITHCEKHGILNKNEEAHLVIADITEARANIRITIAATRIALELDKEDHGETTEEQKEKASQEIPSTNTE